MKSAKTIHPGGRTVPGTDARIVNKWKEGKVGKAILSQENMPMTQEEQAAIEFIEQKIQELDDIHKQALNALNAVLGKDRLLTWKKEMVGLVTEKIGTDHGKQLSKDWLETSYFVGDLFDELSDDVEMCRRHLKKLSKEIRTDGLPSHTSPENNPD